MNKRSIAAGLIFPIVLSFCACGKTQPRTTTNQDSFIVDATLGTATEATPTTATDAEETATATEPEAMVETTTTEYTEVTKESIRTERLASAPKEPETTTEQIVVTTEAVTEAPVAEESTESTNSEMYYYATYATTGYVATGSACADGQMPSAGYTVASNDPGLWNKWIYIEGIGTRYVHDRGGMASNVLDVFCSSVSECYSITSGGRAIYIYY